MAETTKPSVPATLTERLAGIVRIPVNDGAGQLDGLDYFERHFPASKLALEAKVRIEELEAETLQLRASLALARSPGVDLSPSSAGKHTPGPWLPSTFGSQVLTGDSWSVVCELKGAAEWEDGRGKYQQEFAWQIQQANARLIAAAPDMLGALKLAAQAFEGPLTGVEERALHAVLTTIAKATGGAA